jgi:hypothetical protein
MLKHLRRAQKLNDIDNISALWTIYIINVIDNNYFLNVSPRATYTQSKSTVNSLMLNTSAAKCCVKLAILLDNQLINMIN